MAAIVFASDILRHTCVSNQWQEVTIPDRCRVFTVNNESATDNALVAYATTNGDAGAIHANDEYVTVPPLATRIFQLGSGGPSRAYAPALMYVGANPANTPQLALEVQRA